MRITPVFIKNNFTYQNKISKNLDKDTTLQSFSNEFILERIQTVYNVSFCARPAPPVYLIDKNLNCKLYSKQSDLAKELGVSPQRVSGCLNGRNPLIGENIIVYHHQIEKELDDGAKVVDKKKVAEIYNSRTQPRAVYAMDYLGNLVKYDSQNKIESTKGLFIIPACEVESFDNDGQLVLNKKKIALGLLNSPNYAAIYSRDENGKLKKYENQSVFAQENGVSSSSVSAAITGRIKTVCGYNIIPSIVVETVSDEGEITIDKQKMIDYLSKNVRDEKVVYTVSPNLEYKRYQSKKELAEEIGINYSSMIKTSRNVTPNGEYVIAGNTIEDFDENFCLVVNKAKMAKIVAEKLSQEKLYVIDIDMNIKKYDDMESVAEALNRKLSTIRTTLWKPELHKTVADRVIVRASEIEILDENGNISIDRKKVAQLVQERLCKSAVYLIDDKGKYKKYKNRFAVASAYACRPSASQNVRINGFVMVDANMIEKIEEDGSIVLDKEKILEYSKKSKASF